MVDLARTRAVVAALGLVASVASGDEPPVPVSIGMVAPDIVAVRVRAGRVEYGRQSTYRPENADRVIDEGANRVVMRGNEFLGFLVGRAGKTLYTPDRVAGIPLDADAAMTTTAWLVGSSKDTVYRAGLSPVVVERKSKPSDLARIENWKFDAPSEHVFYLRMPQPLTRGVPYMVWSAGDWMSGTEFVYEPRDLRSEAVHVSQVGFRPDDPAKVAFLSCWMGDGGGVTYQEGLTFRLIEEETGRTAFEGHARLGKAARDRNEDRWLRNYAGADVHELDFSAFDVPGRYRVSVEGVGCSYPFEIGTEVWREAFRVSARGFYHQRSGISLGPPYTSYRRPRPFHPDDGVQVWQASCRLIDGSRGLSASVSECGGLIAGKTGKVVTDAWGGWMDGGDWDRRIQSLEAAMLLLDLADLRPEWARATGLNIPESGGKVPDVAAEALWCVDFFQRMQRKDGGVRGGVESEAVPRHGERSWQESLSIMAYAPDRWCTYLFAAAAARAARVVGSRDAPRAEAYRERALLAMHWAETATQRLPADGLPQVRDARNLAAAELFRLTGDEKWQRLFVETTEFTDPEADLALWDHHDQGEAAWAYALSDPGHTDPAIRGNCRSAILREADAEVEATARAGFRFAKREGLPAVGGELTKPNAVWLVRAHALTGSTGYLSAAILACQVGAGANPMNMSLTTGLGWESPRHPLHVDSRMTHQEPPPGLTVFGPADPDRPEEKGSWGQEIVRPWCHPEPVKWPALEAYWDVFWYPSICEYTVQSPMAQTAYVWGYLAAR